MTAQRSLFTRITIALVLLPVHLYRYTISPLLGANCRFSPSCSNYAVEAIQLHGVVKGGYLTAQRIRKCHPFGGSGYDPVPKQLTPRQSRDKDAE
ncbi:MAG: membrane protein insertion efficiency factor YidD [Alphaproteobacteria bacterium]|nr:membrane protein insertion efficiency factor YidD [Alphaproteobacteria bacterium]